MKEGELERVKKAEFGFTFKQIRKDKRSIAVPLKITKRESRKH